MKRLFILTLVILLFCSCGGKWVYMEDAVLTDAEYVKGTLLETSHLLLTFDNGITVKKGSGGILTSTSGIGYAIGKVYKIYSKPKAGKFKAILKTSEES